MRRRLLSLNLAILMMISLLPVWVVPVAAAESEGQVSAGELLPDAGTKGETTGETGNPEAGAGDGQPSDDYQEPEEGTGSPQDTSDNQEPEGEGQEEQDDVQADSDSDSEADGAPEQDAEENPDSEDGSPDGGEPKAEDYGFTQAADTGYAVFFKNDGSGEDESKPAKKVMGAFASNGRLHLYETMPTFQAAGKAVTSFNTEKDGSGTAYSFSTLLRDIFSTSADAPTKLYAQWTPVSGDYVMYIATGDLRANGADYILRSGLGSNVSLLGEDAFTDGNGNHVVGWSTVLKYWEGTSYCPGEEIALSGNGLTLFAIGGKNYIRFHYEDWQNTQTTATLYFGDDWGSEASLERSTVDKAFLGWNTKPDGSGEWFTKSKKVSDAPHDLYAQYEKYPADGKYCVIHAPDGLENGATIQFLPFSDGKVTLPTQISGGRTVAYWYSFANQYPAGIPVEVRAGEGLDAVIISGDRLYGIIDGDGGRTATGSMYSAGACYITSQGTLSLYTFNDLSPFTRDGQAVTGYVGDVTKKTYGFSDDIWAAMKAEMQSDKIARFTAEYQPVTGGYIQYMGNGAKTADGQSYFIQDGLTEDSFAGKMYEQNRFVAPEGKYFIGWSINKNGGYIGWVNPDTPIDTAENQILYAQWGKNRVIYHTGMSPESTTIDGSTFMRPMNNGTAIFEGWNTEPDGTGGWYCAGDRIPDGAILDLYDQWLEKPESGNYYILQTYSPELSNGRNAQVVPMKSATESITLPELKGATHLGWCEVNTKLDGESKFLDEEPRIHAPGSIYEVKSGDVLGVVVAYITAELNQNYSGYAGKRIYYRLSSAAGLSLLDAKDVFSDNPKATFKGWNSLAAGTGDKVSTLTKAGVYQLFAQWTTAGTSNPGPSGPSISNPSGSSNTVNTSPGTVTTQVNTNPSGTGGRTTTAVPTATVNNGTASSTVTSSMANEIVKQAIANGSESIVIAPQVKGTVTKAVVSIPAGTLNEIGSKTNAGLTVSTSVVTVELTNQGVSGLPNNGTVSISVEKQGNGVELSIEAGRQAVSDMQGGVTLTVPITSAGPGTVAVLVRENGSSQVIRKSVAGNGVIVIPVDGSVKLDIRNNAKSFTDVAAGDWHEGAVAFATAHELFNGTSQNEFSPNQSMTRGMLAVVLHNLESNPAQGVGAYFSDVSSNTWYTDAVAWASARGIVGGYGDGRFGPNDNITREQLAVMLWRYAGQPSATSNVLYFTDADKVSEFALEAMRWAVSSGIINGKGGGVLDPTGRATRAEVAQMMMNFMTK